MRCTIHTFPACQLQQILKVPAAAAWLVPLLYSEPVPDSAAVVPRTEDSALPWVSIFPCSIDEEDEPFGIAPANKATHVHRLDYIIHRDVDTTYIYVVRTFGTYVQ